MVSSQKRPSVRFILGAVSLLVIAAIIFFVSLKEKSSCQIQIYSYSSLASQFGAGPDIARKFQELYSCEAKFIDVGEARSILHRLKTEQTVKGSVGADVVIGIDQFNIDQARSVVEWENLADLISFTPSERLPLLADTSPFLPFDWAPFTFIVKESSEKSVKELSDLAQPSFKKSFSIMDPRTSSPGFQFLVWALEIESPNMLKDIVKNAHSITPSWTKSYGLFKKGETSLAFSYVTSVMYHRLEENDPSFTWADLSQPLPYQIEYVGVPKHSQQKGVALNFVKFLLSKDAQELIMKKNYMFPVIKDVEPGTEFAQIPHFSLIENFHLTETKEGALEVWQNALK